MDVVLACQHYAGTLCKSGGVQSCLTFFSDSDQCLIRVADLRAAVDHFGAAAVTPCG